MLPNIKLIFDSENRQTFQLCATLATFRFYSAYSHSHVAFLFHFSVKVCMFVSAQYT